MGMLMRQGEHIALIAKGWLATEPLIDNDSERVLIISRQGFPLKLFRSHIGPGAHDLLLGPRLRGLGHEGDTEVGHLYAIILHH